MTPRTASKHRKSRRRTLLASLFCLLWPLGMAASPWVTNSTTAPSPTPSTKDIQFVPLTKRFIDMVNNESEYNRYATPTQYNGIATHVSMSMYIEGISSFSAQTMDYHLDMYFYQEWNDSRLVHNGTGPMLIRDKAVFKKIWHPDLYFANARYATFQEITEDNFMVWVYPDGRVWWVFPFILGKLSCWFEVRLQNLPRGHLHDESVECSLRILSYAYPESQLALKWSEVIDPPIDRNAEIRMPDMRLVDIKMGLCNGTYATGTWSCMTAVFYVQREMMHHIIQTYVPTALIVVISWFNFWLDIDSAPARVSLSITTLLTIATQANAVKLALPEVSYMKAIDFWLGMCMTFVFGVMVEYTIAHYAKNQEMHRSAPPNLIVDSTLSTLFGTGSTANSANLGVGEPMMERRSTTAGTLPRHYHKQDKRSNSVLPHSQSAFDYHRPLRPDEPDLHTIRMGPLLQSGLGLGFHVKHNKNTLFSWSPRHGYGETDEDEEDEIAAGYGESDFNNIFADNNFYSKATNNGGEKLSIRKHNSFSGNTAEARLRIPLGLRGSVTTKLDAAGASSLEERRTSKCRHSISRLRHQVARRAMSMKSNVQAQCNLRGRAMAINIDQKSRILFPLAFVIMNIGYWSFYLILN